MRNIVVLANNLQLLDNVLPSVLFAKSHHPDIRIVLIFAHRPWMSESGTPQPSVRMAFALADEILIPSGGKLRSFKGGETQKIPSDNILLNGLQKIRTIPNSAELDLATLLSSLESSVLGQTNVWFDFWSTDDPIFRQVLMFLTTLWPSASFVGFGHGLSFLPEKEEQKAIKVRSLFTTYSPKAKLSLLSANFESLTKRPSDILIPQPNHRWSQEWVDFINLHCGLGTHDALRDGQIGVLVSRPFSRDSRNPWGPSPKTKKIVERDVLDVFKELALDPFFLKHPNERARSKNRFFGFSGLHGVHPLATIQSSKVIVSYGSSIGVDCNRLGGRPEIVYRPDFNFSSAAIRYPSSRGTVVTTKDALRQLARDTLNTRSSNVLQKAEYVPDLLS